MNRISRRNFLKAAGVGAAALGLAACGGCFQLHRIQRGILHRRFFRSGGCRRYHQGSRHRDRLRR